MTTSAKGKAPINRGLFRDYDIQKDSGLNMSSPISTWYTPWRRIF